MTDARRFQSSLDLATLLMLGAAAGVVAAAVAVTIEKIGTPATTKSGSTEPEPPPRLLAERLALTVTGELLSQPAKVVVGFLIHYGTGGALGAGYALLARRWPVASAVKGAVYGLGVWAFVDEIAMALLRLKPPPWRIAPAKHALAFIIHQGFGLALAGVFTGLSSVSSRETIDTRLRGEIPGSRLNRHGRWRPDVIHTL